MIILLICELNNTKFQTHYYILLHMLHQRCTTGDRETVFDLLFFLTNKSKHLYSDREGSSDCVDHEGSQLFPWDTQSGYLLAVIGHCSYHDWPWEPYLSHYLKMQGCLLKIYQLNCN